MIRADEDPAVTGSFDPNANGTGVAGYWTTGMVCTILGPDAMNHIQEEIALALEGNGITLDFANKGQLAGLFDAMTGPYGDGSYGDATISITTSLSADAYYENLTINAGVTLNLGGRRLFVRDTLTMGEGAIIASNGTDAVDWGGGGPPSAGGAGAIGFTVGGGGAGGQGSDSVGNADAGSDPTPNTSTGFSGAGGAGGNGAGGGSPPATSGGAAGALTTPLNGSPAFLPAMQTGFMHYQTAGVQADFMLCGGSGGGGGGSHGGASSSWGYGGSGGGGGGVALVSARILVTPSSGTAARIEAMGGDGGADITGNVSINGAGGGGGGGGTILLTTRVRVGDPGLLVLDVSGGSGGLSLLSGNGSGGSAGQVFELYA